jgi:hypothetical protein
MQLTETEQSPEQWIKNILPTTTAAGVEVVYNPNSHNTQHYAVEWLSEEFNTQITTSENPQKQIIEVCGRRGYRELQSLLTQID